MERNKFIETQPAQKRAAYFTFVVDESLSMGMATKETIMGINEQIQQIKSDFADNKEVNPIISFIKFNGNVQPVFMNKGLDELEEITTENYQPNGSTAMYDAVGFAVSELKKRDDIDEEDTSVLVVVVSDGDENASTEYDAKMVADLVKGCSDTKRWTFAYLGANQDLSEVSESTSFARGNMASFDASNQVGYTMAFASARESLSSYSAQVGNVQNNTLSVQNFFSGDTEAKTEETPDTESKTDANKDPETVS